MDLIKLNLLFRYAKTFAHNRIREVGITDTEHLICAFIFGHRNSSQDNIDSALQLDKTTVAKALISLEKKGYINRIQNPENRRKNVINITDNGKESIKEIVNIYNEWQEKIAIALTAEEWILFEEYCQRLLDVAEKMKDVVKDK